MNVASGYGVASSYGNYGAEKTLPASSKPFTIPTSELADEKTTQKNKVSMKVGSVGVLTFVGERNYDPFKDIAETGSFELPGYIHTKTKPTRSDEEILKDIAELAKEHIKTGQSTNDDQRFLELKDEYISSVSPDRASVFYNSMNKILGKPNGEDYSMSAAFQQIDSQRTYKADEEYKEKEKEKELIDYLLERLENKEKPDDVSTGSQYVGDNGEQNNDMYKVQSQGGKIQWIDFFDPDNEPKGSERKLSESIMCYSGYSSRTLAQQLTEEEMSRKQEVFGSYDAAYDVACGKRDLKMTDRSEAYKEAYNKAYERLTNSSVA